MDKLVMFDAEAMEEMQAAICDFIANLKEKAAEKASERDSFNVTRVDVEAAVEDMIDGPDA